MAHFHTSIISHAVLERIRLDTVRRKSYIVCDNYRKKSMSGIGLCHRCNVHSSGDLGLEKDALPNCPHVGIHPCQYSETKGIEV